VELERLVQDKNVLQSQVAPLEELEARISDLEDRASSAIWKASLIIGLGLLERSTR